MVHRENQGLFAVIDRTRLSANTFWWASRKVERTRPTNEASAWCARSRLGGGGRRSMRLHRGSKVRVLVAQESLENLAAGVLGKLVDEYHVFRRFEVCE